jgi:hypothetical protein
MLCSSGTRYARTYIVGGKKHDFTTFHLPQALIEMAWQPAHP